MAISKDWYNTEFEENETESKHRPPSVEYSFYTAVKTGDMETVIQNCNADSFTNLEGTGVLSRNPVTNLKYHFVVTAAMLTRYCIDGGMEAEQAYRLSDFYILKMDSCTSLRQIADLHHTMAKDFTGKMILQKKLSVLSKPVMQCIDYIYDKALGADRSERTAVDTFTAADTFFFVDHGNAILIVCNRINRTAEFTWSL